MEQKLHHDPVLQALSARVRFASICLRKGELAKALAILEQCERVLPFPTRSNWLAAKNVASRDSNG